MFFLFAGENPEAGKRNTAEPQSDCYCQSSSKCKIFLCCLGTAVLLIMMTIVVLAVFLTGNCPTWTSHIHLMCSNTTSTITTEETLISKHSSTNLSFNTTELVQNVSILVQPFTCQVINASLHCHCYNVPERTEFFLNCTRVEACSLHDIDSTDTCLKLFNCTDKSTLLRATHCACDRDLSNIQNILVDRAYPVCNYMYN